MNNKCNNNNCNNKVWNNMIIMDRIIKNIKFLILKREILNIYRVIIKETNPSIQISNRIYN